MTLFLTCPRRVEGKESSVEFHTLSVDEETIVRGAIGVELPVGGGPIDERVGRVWAPITVVEINGKQGGGNVACRACGRDICRGEFAIRFGIALGGTAVRPAYLHTKRCRRKPRATRP